MLCTGILRAAGVCQSLRCRHRRFRVIRLGAKNEMCPNFDLHLRMI